MSIIIDHDPDHHRTYVERTTNQAGEDVYYAWCGASECFWHSPHRKVKLTVEEFARKHEQKP
jgi:hypothetical protein